MENKATVGLVIYWGGCGYSGEQVIELSHLATHVTMPDEWKEEIRQRVKRETDGSSRVVYIALLVPLKEFL